MGRFSILILLALSAIFDSADYFLLLDALSDRLDFQNFPLAFLLPYFLFTSQFPFLVPPFPGSLSLEYPKHKAQLSRSLSPSLSHHSTGDLIQSPGLSDAS